MKQASEGKYLKVLIRRLFMSFGLLTLALTAAAVEPSYPRELSLWKEISIPSGTNQGARMVWEFAANYSMHEWRVYVEEGKVSARLVSPMKFEKGERPPFTPKGLEFRQGDAFKRVDDGWLIGFNRGEFGASLHWISADGRREYKISDHQVVDFITLPDGVYAIEGLAHLGMSGGSVIRIAREPGQLYWMATPVTKLPFAPYAVSVRRDNSMLLTLSDALVSIDAEHNIVSLLEKAPWTGLYPNSSVLSSDEQKLYIGMRQYVGEFDISSKRLRLLVPADSFVNKLPKDQERQIYKQYGR